MSLVGSPVYLKRDMNSQSKKGLTGTIQVNETRKLTLVDQENYELYYLQNYSVWMDIDILLKTLFSGSNFQKDLDRAIDKYP